MDILLMRQLLAIILLIMGIILIATLFDAYRHVPQQSLLLFLYGLFTLVIGLVFPELLSIFSPDIFWAFWAEIFSSCVAIIAIGVMIYSVLRG